MSRLARHPARDLLAVLGLALLALLALVLPVPSVFQAVLVAPLALLLPGYALSAAIFRPGEIDRGLQAVLTVIFTMGVISVGGLVVQTAIALDTALYACLLLLATIVAAAVALRRRAVRPSPKPVRSPLPRIGATTIAGFAAALLVSAIAIAVATAGQQHQLARERFTAMWILPHGTGREFSASIGVQNEAGSAASFELRAAQRGRPLRRWRFRLGSGDRWHGSLPAGDIFGEAAIVATLFKGDRPYRRVAIHPGGEA
jgi:uncharacterized membrane protein